MLSKNEAEQRRRPQIKILMAIIVIAISIVAAGWTLATVSTISQLPPSDFVTLPTTTLSTKGESAQFNSISTIGQKGLATGMKGRLETMSGKPVAGAKVYVTYYLQFDYRNQVTITDENGNFELHFPMNWTGWLPVTLTYFGDDQHLGMTQVFAITGENL